MLEAKFLLVIPWWELLSVNDVWMVLLVNLCWYFTISWSPCWMCSSILSPNPHHLGRQIMSWPPWYGWERRLGRVTNLLKVTLSKFSNWDSEPRLSRLNVYSPNCGVTSQMPIGRDHCLADLGFSTGILQRNTPLSHCVYCHMNWILFLFVQVSLCLISL